MYPFLILSSLSVGFYLFLLVALHRDAKRHSRRVAVTHPTPFGGHTAIRLARSKGRALASKPGSDWSGDVHWQPVATVHLKPAARIVQVHQSRPVIAAVSVTSVSQVKCGEAARETRYA